MGIEPTSKAWEALILPMNYARLKIIVTISKRHLDCDYVSLKFLLLLVVEFFEE